jgi:hypothetical protein
VNRTAKAAAKLRRILKRLEVKQARQEAQKQINADLAFIETQECLHAESAFARSVAEETEVVYDHALGEMIMEGAL